MDTITESSPSSWKFETKQQKSQQNSQQKHQKTPNKKNLGNNTKPQKNIQQVNNLFIEYFQFCICNLIYTHNPVLNEQLFLIFVFAK